MKASLLFIIYNRPETTRLVFDKIREVKPEKLFVVADGPHERRPMDVERCLAARAVTESVDWPCEVYRKYRNSNAGCRKGCLEAIDWFLEHVDEGIILEDDCLPSISFFSFCEELLEKYRGDTRVMAISGDNFQFGRVRGDASYFFSRVGGIWGWATWRRAWVMCEQDLATLPKFKREGWNERLFADRDSRRFWLTKAEELYYGADGWDFAWFYSIFKNNGLCIVPNVNLVSNIGFGSGVHAVENRSKFACIPVGHLARIVHPDVMLPYSEADKFYSQVISREQLSRFQSGVMRMLKLKNMLLNRHFYGYWVRKAPVLGQIWARWRRDRTRREYK